LSKPSATFWRFSCQSKPRSAANKEIVNSDIFKSGCFQWSKFLKYINRWHELSYLTWAMQINNRLFNA
jgi:hypothetical protein